MAGGWLDLGSVGEARGCVRLLLEGSDQGKRSTQGRLHREEESVKVRGDADHGKDSVVR